MNSRNALGFAGVITRDMHYWESDPFIMHQREDLLLHLMFTLRNVCLETMQGDLTGGSGVIAENASLHMRNGTARERDLLAGSVLGKAFLSPRALPVCCSFCFI